MVDGCYDATFPKGSRDREPTCIEKELGITGTLMREVGVAGDVLTITVGGGIYKIECVCACYPGSIAVDCPLHYRGSGKPRVVEDLRAILAAGTSSHE